MLTRLFLALSAVLFFASQAHAWAALAFDRNSGYAFTQFDAESPDEAMNKALAGCRKYSQNTDCNVIDKAYSGTAFVVVKGVTGNAGQHVDFGANKDPKKSAESALKYCRDGGYRNCTIVDAIWDSGPSWASFAMADDGSGSYVYRGGSTQAEAENGAISGCREEATNADCKVPAGFTVNVPAWYVFAGGDTYATVFVRTVKAEAEKAALMECSEHTSNCKVTSAFQHKGNPPPVSFKDIEAKAKKGKVSFYAALDKAERAYAAKNKPTRTVSNGNCRPRSEYIRCRSSCSNGDCIVTYENGCKIRVQVQPKFNPFNNQWEYPSPSC